MHPLYAGIIGSSLLSAACPTGGAAQGAPERTVQAQMRNVAFHVDSTTVLAIHYARGMLRRTAPEHPAYLDDKNSFVLDLDTARFEISPAALSQVLNRYTFNYPGSPLRKLVITIDHGRLRQHGRMRGISFDVVGELSLTPTTASSGSIPRTIKAVGIKVGGLMKFFGLSLEKLVNTERARGVRIERDDFILSPTKLLPSPAVDGRLGAFELSDSAIVLIFHPPDGRKVQGADAAGGRAGELHVLPAWRAAVRQADHGRHRSPDPGRRPAGLVRFLAGPVQRSAGGGELAEHAGSWVDRADAGLEGGRAVRRSGGRTVEQLTDRLTA